MGIHTLDALGKQVIFLSFWVAQYNLPLPPIFSLFTKIYLHIGDPK